MLFFEVIERVLNGDEELLKRAAEGALKILRLFDKKWFQWEIIGWALARLLGIPEDEIDEMPEIGWAVKASVGYMLSGSKRKRERLLGRALLRLTEVPPQSILVEYGEDTYMPALVAHYRTSWNFPDIRATYEKVVAELEASKEWPGM